MKVILILPFFLTFLINLYNFESTHAGSFKPLKSKDVPFANFSLVPNTKILKMTKFNCFSQCLRNEFCEFVVYKNNICSFHTEYALTRLITVNNLNVVFEKTFIIE